MGSEVICSSCGKQHALFWWVTQSGRSVHYACDKWPVEVTTKVNPVPRIEHRFRRIPYDGHLPGSVLDSLPTFESKGYILAQAKKQQRQFLF